MMPVFADLADLEEDKRIEMIGDSVMKTPRTSADKPVMNAFVVDDDAKADRYIKKLQDKFPGIRIIDRSDGPIKGRSVTVRIGGPLR